MSYFISINKEESCQHLVKSHNPLCKTPTINLLRHKALNRFFAAPTTARINIVGQAPGIKAQESRLYWNDKSGDRLREWLGVDRDTFYHSGIFAVIPMDFYYPGKGKSGDLPPRKGFAEKWHPLILANLPNIELTILIGQYAQNTICQKITLMSLRQFSIFVIFFLTFFRLFTHLHETKFGSRKIYGLNKR